MFLKKQAPLGGPCEELFWEAKTTVYHVKILSMKQILSEKSLSLKVQFVHYWKCKDYCEMNVYSRMSICLCVCEEHVKIPLVREFFRLLFYQKSNSWTYNVVEVSGHNFVRSQTWGSVNHVYTLEGSFKPLFLKGERVGLKSVSRGDIE